MINSITVTNHRGESLKIDLRNPWEAGLAVMQIDGLHPPQASISSTDLSTKDGSVFNSARIATRNIVIRFKILDLMTVEEARHILYKYFPIKQKIRVIFDTDTRDVYADGYIETTNVEIFSNFETASVSIICTDPYLYAVQDQSTALNDIVGGFEFPFENPNDTNSITFGEYAVTGPVDIVYEGEQPVGVVIDVHATGDVGTLRIYSMTTDEEILLDATKLAAKTGSGLTAGDNLKISTVPGDKFVRLYRSGVEYNVLSCVSRNNGWIHLEHGDNILVYSAVGVSNAQIYVTNKLVYEGI